MALAFGIAGFYNLPLRDYAQYSIRGGGVGGGVGMEYATAWSLAPCELPTVVIPERSASAARPTGAACRSPTTRTPTWASITVAAGCCRRCSRSGRLRVVALTLAGLALLVAMGRYFPLYGFLYEHLPLFNKFRVPVMILVLFQLAAALGLAWGWSARARGSGPEATAIGWSDCYSRPARVLVVLLVMAIVVARGAGAPAIWRRCARTRPDLPPRRADGGVRADSRATWCASRCSGSRSWRRRCSCAGGG